jgi:hypothetical protein
MKIGWLLQTSFSHLLLWNCSSKSNQTLQVIGCSSFKIIFDSPDIQFGGEKSFFFLFKYVQFIYLAKQKSKDYKYDEYNSKYNKQPICINYNLNIGLFQLSDFQTYISDKSSHRRSKTILGRWYPLVINNPSAEEIQYSV